MKIVIAVVENEEEASVLQAISGAEVHELSSAPSDPDELARAITAAAKSGEAGQVFVLPVEPQEPARSSTPRELALTSWLC